MKEHDFDEYINERYKPELEWYKSRANHAKRVYMFFQWGLIILAALTPILVTVGEFGINVGKETEEYSNLKLSIEITSIITAFLVAVLSSALKTFQYQENWIEFRDTEQMLRSEFYLFQAELGRYERTTDKHSLFVDNVERCIRKELKSWEFRTETDGTRGKEKADHPRGKEKGQPSPNGEINRSVRTD